MNSINSSKAGPKVSIGMPVYNAGYFLRERLDNILSQTFADFELIISDNASTDSTLSICEEYSKKDKRIRCFRREKNMGGFWNFSFVLQQAKYELFVWAAVDDKWNADFLEKNVSVLESNKNIVGSTGRVERYGLPVNEFKPNPTYSLVKKSYKKIRRHFRPFGTFPAFGPWEKKAGFYLRHQSAQSIYAVYRTDKLKVSVLSKPISAWDMAVILNVLKHGDLHVIDEVLWYWYTGGDSSRGLIDRYSKGTMTLKQLIFGPSSFVRWCIRNHGIKFFLKNFDCFIWLYCINPIGLTMELIQIFKQKVSSRESKKFMPPAL